MAPSCAFYLYWNYTYLVLRTGKLLTFTVWHQVVHFILLESTEKILAFTVRHLIVHCIFLEFYLAIEQPDLTYVLN